MDKTMDMTRGSAVKHILMFSVPMLVGNIFQQVYNIVDSIIVGRFLGANALAAVGATGSITFLFFALCNGIGSGGGIITSQFFGSHDEKKVKRCIANAGYIMFFFPLVVGIVSCFLARPILVAMKTPADIMDDAVIYTQVLCIGLLFVSVYNYVSSMLRALGDSRTPLYFLIFSCLLNVGLDFLFVCGFSMGVLGAGIATVLSQLIGGAGCLYYAFRSNPYFKLTKEDLKFDKDMTFKALGLGIPLSLQFSLIAISTMALQRVVNSFGAIAVAAFTATSRIEQLVHQPYQTLSSSLSTYCGQNYGAKDSKRVFDGYRKCILLMLAFTILIVPCMQMFGDNITSWFVSDGEVIEMGRKALQITSLFYVFLGLIYVTRGILNGVGDAFFAMLNGIVEIVGRFTVPILMTRYMGIGLWGIWWSVGIVWGISGITAWMRYLTQRSKISNISDTCR